MNLSYGENRDRDFTGASCRESSPVRDPTRWYIIILQPRFFARDLITNSWTPRDPVSPPNPRAASRNTSDYVSDDKSRVVGVTNDCRAREIRRSDEVERRTKPTLRLENDRRATIDGSIGDQTDIITRYFETIGTRVGANARKQRRRDSAPTNARKQRGRVSDTTRSRDFVSEFPPSLQTIRSFSNV